jgi:membrane-associated phospholipid phosphatase
VSVRPTLILLFTIVATRGSAQTLTGAATAARDSVASNTITSPQRELGRNTLWMLTGALAAGVATSMFDSQLLTGTQYLGDHAEMDRGSAIGNMIGGPGPIALGATLYLAGRGFGDGFLTNAGRNVMRAVVISGGITALTKGIVGRTRPFASPGDADKYSPGHGFLNSARASFPSGHTSAAFATATVLARELNVAHPKSRWIVNPLLFGCATFVGFSRIYDNQHWPSDVIVGAALGSITGYEVVAHAHGDRSHISGGFLSHLTLGPHEHAMELGWSLQ